MVSSEEVLAFLPGSVSVFYGMVRTVVVTGEAAQAGPVMFPHGLFPQSSDDIMHRTDIRADSALHAFLPLHMERFVRDEVPHEEASDRSAEE